MLGDISNRVSEVLQRRLDSPFLFSFFVALAAANYRVAFVLFGSGSYDSRFEYIDIVLYPELWDWWRSFIVYPFLVALFYTFVWPFIDMGIQWLLEKIANCRRRLEIAMQGAIPVTLEKKEEWLKDQRALEAELRAEVTRYKELWERAQTDEKLLRDRSQQRFRKLAIQTLAGQYGLAWDDVETVFKNTDVTHLGTTVQAKKYDEKLKALGPYLKRLSRLMPYLDNLRPNGDGERVVERQRFSDEIGESLEAVVDFFEPLVAMEFFQPSDDMMRYTFKANAQGHANLRGIVSRYSQL